MEEQIPNNLVCPYCETEIPLEEKYQKELFVTYINPQRLYKGEWEKQRKPWLMAIACTHCKKILGFMDYSP